MDIVIKKSTLSLIESFRKRHASHEWESGKSNTAAMAGAMMLLSANISQERGGSTLMSRATEKSPQGNLSRDIDGGAVFEEYTMKSLFERASAHAKPDDTVKVFMPGVTGDLHAVHNFMKANGVLKQDSTIGDALDLAMPVAHHIVTNHVWLKKDGRKTMHLVFI